MGKAFVPRFRWEAGESFRDCSSILPRSRMEQGRDLLLCRQLASRRQLVNHSGQDRRQLIQELLLADSRLTCEIADRFRPERII